MEAEGVGATEHRHLLALAAVLPALTLGIGVVTALGATTFPDPAGDVQGGPGPDLASITVSHTPATVTFRVRFAKAPPLRVSVKGRWVDMLLIGIDVPPRSLKRGHTGWLGVDYVAGLHGTEKTAILVKAPSRPSEQGKVVARPTVTARGRTLSFSVSRKALGNPTWIEFVAATGRETSEQANGAGGDEAPNRGSFHYRLRR